MENKKIIGIDLGGTSAKFGIINLKGEIEKQWSIQTDVSEEGIHIIPNIIESVNSKLKSLHLRNDDFIGIGMGSPGIVNRKLGSVSGAYNLNWANLQELKSPIEKATGIPFYIDNDANVAALGEQWVGAGNNHSNLVFITLGTGVGGGLISAGKLVRGANDAAGEIGHITVEPDGYLCTCGKNGCLEQYASATGVMRIAYDMSNQYTGNSRLKAEIDGGQLINSKRIFDLAKMEDELALAVTDRFGYYLSLALGNVANLLNPSAIILGGGVSKAGDFLLNIVRQKIKPFLFETIQDTVEIKNAELGNDAGIIGAASLVLNDLK